MAHGTLINGVQRNITGGYTLVNGVERNIVKGLISEYGVQREILLGNSGGLPKFYVYNGSTTKRYSYEDGMTWEEFVASDYNDGTFDIWDGSAELTISVSKGNGTAGDLRTYEGFIVSPSDIIEAGMTYQV